MVQHPLDFGREIMIEFFSRFPITLTGQVCRQPPMFANRIVRYPEILISEELGRSTLLSEAINSFKISAFFPLLENVNE
jgi:hypothetical protein